MRRFIPNLVISLKGRNEEHESPIQRNEKKDKVGHFFFLGGGQNAFGGIWVFMFVGLFVSNFVSNFIHMGFQAISLSKQFPCGIYFINMDGLLAILSWGAFKGNYKDIIKRIWKYSRLVWNKLLFLIRESERFFFLVWLQGKIKKKSNLHDIHRKQKIFFWKDNAKMT